MPFNKDVEAAAIKLVQEEVAAYENPQYYITEDIAFNIRELIRQCRKNYHGIFDNPKDKVSGRTKIHPKLTQVMVENVVKSIDMDTKHFGFRSKRGRKGIATAELLRHLTREHFKRTHFGEKLDEAERVMCIDGTAITKSWVKKVNGKDKLVTKLVDRLNFYIDPTAESIADAHRVTERSVQSVSKVKAMDWENTNKVEANQNINSNPTEGSPHKTSNDVDVYETWGQIPKWIVDNKEADDGSGKEVEARIVVSGVKSDSPVLHLIEVNNDKDSEGQPIRPYEEMRYRKIQGRWDGLGIAEQIWTLEMWYALTVNARINRNTLAQLGIFTVKKSGNLTGTNLARMASNGIVTVTNHDDINQMPITEAGVTSYKDEEVINDIAQKLTGAFEVAIGDALPASATATSSAIQDKNASKAFTLVQDQISFWGARWMDRHLKPYLASQVKKGDVVMVTADTDGFDQLRKRVVAYLIDQRMEELFNEGKFPTEDALQRAIASTEEKLAQDGGMYLKVVSKLILDGVDAETQIANEDLNVGAMMNNIIQLMQVDQEAVPFYRDVISDLMGIPRPPRTSQTQQLPQQVPNGLEAQSTQPNEVDEVTRANTLAA